MDSMAPFFHRTVYDFFQGEYFFGYKQAHRKEDDIAIVNAGMRVIFEGKTTVVKDLRLVYGGMAPTTVMAVNTMKMAKGR
jgi:xanthine dehydrogenase/oxidase